MADIEKCNGPDDPERCQGMTKIQGQCHYKRMPDAQYCALHGGNSANQQAEKARIRNYQIAKWQTQIDQKTDAIGLKSLREEIAILRMLLEHKLNLCNDSTDLVLSCQSISDLALKIEKLVSSTHRLETSLGSLLDKQAILNFASEVISIITEELVGQDELISKVGDRLMAAVGNQGTMKEP